MNDFLKTKVKSLRPDPVFCNPNSQPTGQHPPPPPPQHTKTNLFFNTTCLLFFCLLISRLSAELVCDLYGSLYKDVFLPLFHTHTHTNSSFQFRQPNWRKLQFSVFILLNLFFVADFQNKLAGKQEILKRIKYFSLYFYDGLLFKINLMRGGRNRNTCFLWF